MSYVWKKGICSVGLEFIATNFFSPYPSPAVFSSLCLWVKQLGVGLAQCVVLATHMHVCECLSINGLPVSVTQVERIYEQRCVCLNLQSCVYVELNYKWFLVEKDKWGLYALTSACAVTCFHCLLTCKCKLYLQNNGITQSKSTP